MRDLLYIDDILVRGFANDRLVLRRLICFRKSVVLCFKGYFARIVFGTMHLSSVSLSLSLSLSFTYMITLRSLLRRCYFNMTSSSVPSSFV